jgi:coenzyme Q-binding protein COQ10
MPTHAEKRDLPYSRAQLFDLVADVEKYPEFLPWCVGSRVRSSEENVIIADLVIGYKLFRERFTSKVTLDKPARIDVAYTNGPFRYLDNHWVFDEAADGKSCAIDFYVDFEFRSKLMQKMIGVVFNEAVKRMVQAFENRAHDLYGQASDK